MDQPLLERFRRLIANYTGLVIPERDDPSLRAKLGLRTHALRFAGMESYLNFLETDAQEARGEWQVLIRELTTVESYFFRDSGQMKLLREVILPELIARHREERVLRLWSAGCASGEEPYSLAMLLLELLPADASWRIVLMGTDINDHPLRRAMEGIYGQWSFRGVEPEWLERHFHKHGEEWRLNEGVRDMVEFRLLNLLKEEFPAGEIRDFDLIVCRNVFIYFDRVTITRIVKKFARSLGNGGYLLTGHGEIPHPMADILGLGPDRLVARSYPDSVIFQRPAEEPVVSTVPLPRIVKKSMPVRPSAGKAPAVKPAKGALLQEALSHFGQGAYRKAIPLATELVDDTTHAFAARMLLARIHANLGENRLAEQWCRKALRINPVASGPHFLLAHLFQERGEPGEVADLLRKVIYLDRAHIPAYLELAALYQMEGDLARARRMRVSAMESLRALPPHTRIEGYEEWTAEELGRQLNVLLEK
ncbi:MAG: tetratricopeptide repeat protein [Magnetococcales bacterium]|nr:tetratricopeptide repeat protein [Magnetococcales bacterium]